MVDYQTSLPWSSDRAFEVSSYRASHSELTLRTLHSKEDMLHILFVGIERMEINRLYYGGLTLSTLDEYGPYPRALHVPYLLVKLETPDHDGFVATSGIRITRRTPENEELELILTASKEKNDPFATLNPAHSSRRVCQVNW